MSDSWIPIRIEDTVVQWADLDRPLHEPFFDQTVAQHLREGGRVRETDLEALLQLLEDEGPRSSLYPRGFVFHMSRCGSTLLANALRLVEGARVVGEPATLNQLLMSELPRQEELLRALVVGLGRPRAGARHLFIKFTSTNVRHCALIQRTFPDVPCLFICREPAEVLASVLERPPGWLRVREEPALAARALGLPEERIVEGSAERYAACVLGALCESAIELRNVQVLDYSELTPAGFHRATQHFGVPTPPLERLEECFDRDAKRGQAFIRRESGLRDSASVQELAERWARPAYRRLRALHGGGVT